jgi:hypothetical protein
MPHVSVVLFRDAASGEYLVPRPSPGLEQLQPGDHVVLYNGREVTVVRTIRRSQNELQILCDSPGRKNSSELS